mgnify:CR=1 FL=1
MRWEHLICCRRLLDLENEPWPDAAPWPSTISQTQTLKTLVAARCLRVRLKAMHDFLLCFKGHPIVYYANLWMDQHAPLILALENSNAGGVNPDDVAFSPIEQKPKHVELPQEAVQHIPLLWTNKSALTLKTWPILKLLWKAAPRKSHSADVGNMVQALLDDPKHSQKYTKVVMSIHQASMLGNYKHCTQHPPLPLRLAIYRMGVDSILEQSTSKHPFFLYCLKEVLVSCIRNDFGVRYQLQQFSAEFSVFEEKVISCCDKILRPYAAVSSSISARLLMTHGKGATLNPSSMATQPKRVHAICKVYKGKITPEQLADLPKRNVLAMTHKEWTESKGAGQSMDLSAKLFAPGIAPFYSVPLPDEKYKMQKAALRKNNDLAPEIYTCKMCRGGFFVGYNTGGKKTEALGDVMMPGRYFCPRCNQRPEPELQKISLLGQIVFCDNGAFSSCQRCARPTVYFHEGVHCYDCCMEEAKYAQAEELKRGNCTRTGCWYARCSRKCTSSFRVVPLGGLDEGETWHTYLSCQVHALPEYLTQDPIPEELVKKYWWQFVRGGPR